MPQINYDTSKILDFVTKFHESNTMPKEMVEDDLVFIDHVVAYMKVLLEYDADYIRSLATYIEVHSTIPSYAIENNDKEILDDFAKHKKLLREIATLFANISNLKIRDIQPSLENSYGWITGQFNPSESNS